MTASLSRFPSTRASRTIALRVVGVTAAAFVVLVVTLLLVRPEMMMTAMHRAMVLIFVP
jgi:hypothetical protein